MTKTIHLLAVLLLHVGSTSAQQKSATPLETHHSSLIAHHSTRAVVVGISNYREPLIPDLKYADRDAQAFADWLRSPAGLALPDSSIQLLLNQYATNAQMIVSLDWLIEQSRPGDRAFIYFSGHGDVERVSKFQRGFLLGHDSPPAVYGAGAFSLGYLQDILSTLAEKNVQVFVITDACRAGKLASSSIGGTQATATQLAQQFANEIKILSCQPDEFSLEGEQWGGGRGCFSWHLEDALYGFADENHDAAVDLLEMRRYLEDHVAAEAAPQSQTPMVSGPVKTRISTFRESDVAARRATKDKRPVAFRDIENRGIETLLLANTDSSLQRLYARFLAAIDSGQLMSPAGRSADDYFKTLISKPELAALHGAMKRKLAAALIEEGQTIINKVMQTDIGEVEKCWVNYGDYDHLPAYFHRAAEMLGERHYAYKNLKATALYFQFLTTGKGVEDKSSDLLHEALSFDSSLAIIYFVLGNEYGDNEYGRVFYQKAAELAPNWVMIHNWVGYTYFNSEPEKGIFHHKKALAIDPNNVEALIMIGWNYVAIGQPDSARMLQKMAIEKLDQKFQSYPTSITTTDCISVAQALRELKEFEKAKEYLLLGEKISKGRHGGVYGNLVLVYTDLLEFENAVNACNTMFDVNHSKTRNWVGMPGHIYFNYLYDNAAAIQHYERTKTVETNQVQAWFSLDKQKCLASAQKAMLDSVASDFCLLAFYAGEAANALGMKDSATHYFKLIVEKAEITLMRNDVSMPDYLFAAFAYDRLGQIMEFQKLIEKAKDELKGDAWLYYNLARIFANTKQPAAATESLEKAFLLGWQPNFLVDIHGTLCDLLLNPIRESEAYKKLVREHFPKYYDIATRVPGRH